MVRAAICIAVVLYREQPAVKTRLAAELSATQRLALARDLLTTVLRALLGARHLVAVLLVGDSPPPAEFAASGRLQHIATDLSLNEAAALGCRAASTRGANEVLLSHADLPQLDAATVDALIEAGRALRGAHAAALASCQHRDGTSLLWLRPAEPLVFRYGRGSYARHLDLLGAQGYEVAELPAVADVDSRADLLQTGWRG